MHYVLSNRPDIIIELCYGYERRESAMACGGVLREALKHDAVAALILYDEPDRRGKDMLASIDPTVPSSGDGVFWKFFEWIDRGAFEACADAFNTFRVRPIGLVEYRTIVMLICAQDILTKHKALVSDYLQTNFDRFFKTYNSVLVQSDSYVTKRQSIKLLGELLLDRANYNVMTQYVASGEHLKIIMKLLRDDRRMINYEGFHVFKVRAKMGKFGRLPECHADRLGTGLRCESEQISGRAKDPDQQQGPPAQVPAHIPRRSDGRRPVHGREKLSDPTDRTAPAGAGSSAAIVNLRKTSRKQHSIALYIQVFEESMVRRLACKR